jgi:hypothetical protein
MWSIDRAAIEFGEPTIANAEPLRVRSAVDRKGRDRRSALRAVNPDPRLVLLAKAYSWPRFDLRGSS